MNFRYRRTDICLENIPIDEEKRFIYDFDFETYECMNNKNVNCFPITDIKNIENFVSLESNDERDIINMFSFKVDKERDLLQSDENNKAFCIIYHYKNEVSLYDKAVKYLKDKLKELEETKDASNVIESSFYYDYEYGVKEYPYVMYLAGVDDNSYTLVTDNLEDLKKLADIIKTNKNIDTYTFLKIFKFRYTN